MPLGEAERVILSTLGVKEYPYSHPSEEQDGEAIRPLKQKQMMMTEEDKTDIAHKVIELFKTSMPERRATCNFCEDRKAIERHEAHHEFLDKLILLLDRMDGIKWNILKQVFTVITLSLLGLIAALLWKYIITGGKV